MLAASQSDQLHDEDQNRSWYGEARLMKVSKTWSCLLLLGAVLNLSGCQQILKILGIGRDDHNITPTSLPVSISKCAVVGAGNDPIIEHTGIPVTWKFSDGIVYVISIDAKTDQNTPTPPISTSVTNTLSGAQWDNAVTPTDCSIDIATHKGTGCYFKYNIAVKGGKVCNDPGIQIIP